MSHNNSTNNIGTTNSGGVGGGGGSSTRKLSSNRNLNAVPDTVYSGWLKIRRSSPPASFQNHPHGMGVGARWGKRYFVLTPTELIQASNEDMEETFYIPFSAMRQVIPHTPGTAFSSSHPASPNRHHTNNHTSTSSPTATPTTTSTSTNQPPPLIHSGGGTNSSGSTHQLRTFGAMVTSSVRALFTGVTSGINSSSHHLNSSDGSTQFSIELHGDAADTRAIITFEADDAATCSKWMSMINARLETPVDSVVLTKEDSGKSVTDMYDLGVSLGSGMSGVVKKIIRKSDGKAFAMKSVSLQNLTGKQLTALRNEIDILKSLDHPHIAKLYEVYTEPGTCVRLILELCEGGELFDRLHLKKRLDEAWVARLVFRMAGVLRYLHENNIAHRDLKLENWLFRSKKDDDEIVLIDFGLSHRYRNNEHMHKKVGTSYYVAPEVLKGDYVGVQADVWSLGVIVYMLLAGTAPFDGADDEAILARIATHKPPNYETGAWKRVSSEGKDFVSKLLCVNPDERWTAERALSHPWILAQSRSIAAEKKEINDEIYNNLSRFANFSTLKRIAIEAVAFSLPHDDIKNLTNVFEGLDSDNNGYISFAGLKRGLMKHHTISEEECYRIFEALDAEHSGKIHLTEFVAAALQEKYHNDERYLRHAFAAMDHGNTGYITVADLKLLLGKHVSRERALEMIKAAELDDHGDDHKLSWNEFLKYVKSEDDEFVSNVVSGGSSPIRSPATTHHMNAISPLTGTNKLTGE
jgi:calcium-dependent protein kinase